MDSVFSCSPAHAHIQVVTVSVVLCRANRKLTSPVMQPAHLTVHVAVVSKVQAFHLSCPLYCQSQK